MSKDGVGGKHLGPSPDGAIDDRRWLPAGPGGSPNQRYSNTAIQSGDLGVNQYDAIFSIDYLGITVSSRFYKELRRWGGRCFGDGGDEESYEEKGSGGRGYRKREVDKSGVSILSDGYGVCDKLVKVVVRGYEQISRMGVSDLDESMRLFKKYIGGRIRWRRIDVAFDVCYEGLRCKVVSDMVGDGRIKQSWGRKVKRLDTVVNWSVENGDTLYLGDRKSGRYVRIYDKRIWDRDCVRFEVEYRDVYAKLIGGVWYRRGVEEMIEGVKADWRAHFLCDEEWWKRSIEEGRAIALTVNRGKKLSVENRRKWIEKTCMPTLVKVVDDYGWEWFWDAYKFAGGVVSEDRL